MVAVHFTTGIAECGVDLEIDRANFVKKQIRRDNRLFAGKKNRD